MATLPRDTERLGFRHLGDDDLDAVVALYEDSAVVRFVGRYDRAEFSTGASSWPAGTLRGASIRVP